MSLVPYKLNPAEALTEPINPQNKGLAVPYEGLEWQLSAYREPGNTEKALLLFDASQEKLVQVGYERHPSSAEVFSLICAYFDDQKRATKKLTPEQTDVVKDMCIGHGELFCQLIEITQTGILSKTRSAMIYELVTALPRNAINNRYEKSRMQHSGTPKTFNVSDLKLGQYHFFKNICDKHDDLIEYLTSRKFNMLPDKIKENGGVGLPSPGAVLPIGRDDCITRLGIIFNLDWASRGVRRAKSPAGNKG